MGILTIDLSEEVVEKLKECGAYVPEIVHRGIRNLFAPILIQYGISSATEFQWEIDARG